jgi:tRNA(Ile)-lysidine synthase
MKITLLHIKLMKNLVKKIQNNIFQQSLFARGDGLILGISGGPDSVCLAEILARLQKKYDLKIILAHVNYALRGKDSELDQKIVEDLAQKYGLELFILKPKKTLTPTLSLKRARGPRFPSEESLRNIRYDFFEKVRKENSCDYIAVAHTLDDQAETFFMRLLRGTGLSGLSGIKFKNVHPVKSVSPSEIPKGSEANFTGQGGPAKREFNREIIIRPLLNVSKKEILEYLKKNKIKYRVDKTNKENIFFRNKIRNVLIPMLEKDFNPSIKETIFKSSLSILDDYALLSNLARKEYAKIFSKNGVGSVHGILALPESLQRMVLREAIAGKKENLRDIDAAHIEEIRRAIKSSKSKSQKVFFKGLKIVRNGDKITISELV